MGHLRLGRLPRTRKWKEVIGLVDGGGSAAQVADATIDAAEDQLEGADPAVVHAVWLLTRLPDAARSEDFGGALRDLGIAVSAQPSPAELAAALGRAVDDHLYAGGHTRSDVGEMARLAAVETLARAAEPASPGLFGPRPGDAQDALARLGTEKQFGVFARDFFARLTERVLTYYVSKELPLHVGPGQRFGNVDEQRAFQDAVALHARQAARIVEEFAGGWWSKARYEQDLSPDRAARFVAYAMKKMRGELRRGAS
ncbi:hypothetical protein L6R53_26650 [Myxococcota bacterium]|nr:hypothetical protein [Myxococcota bacterium]